jgi:HEAT repeat protein
MTGSNPVNIRYARRWVAVIAGCLLAGAVTYCCNTPEDKADTVNRRVAALLAAARRQEFRDAAPLWFQKAQFIARSWTSRLFTEVDEVSLEEELAALGTKAIPALSRALLKEPSPAARSLSASALGQLEEPQSVPALTNALSVETNELVVPAISRALAQIGDSRGVPAMITAFGRQTNDDVRVVILGGLGKFHDSRVLRMLTAALTNESNADLRSAAVEALGEIGDPTTFANVAPVLEADPDEEVRKSAADTLGKLRVPEAVHILSRQMRVDPSPAVRGGAASALRASQSAEIVNELVSALAGEKNEDVRQQLLWTLGSMECPAAGEALMVIATNDPSPATEKLAIELLAQAVSQQPATELLRIVQETPFPELRQAAAVELVDAGGPEVVPTLTNLLAKPGALPHPAALAAALGVRGIPEVLPMLLRSLTLPTADAEMREEAVRALGIVGDCRALGPLIGVLTNDPECSVRSAAATALGSLRSKAAVPALIEVTTCQKTNTQLCEASIPALGQLQDRQAVPVLLACLASRTDDGLRAVACEALGEIGAPATAAFLAKLARREKVITVRRAAIRALGRLGGPEAVSTLRDMLARGTRGGTQDRLAVLVACEATGNLSTAPALINALEDADQRVVAAAAEALGSLGSVDALPTLMRLGQTSTHQVRVQTAKALGRIGDRRAAPALVEMVRQDRSPEARTKAAEALALISEISAIPALQAALADPAEEVRTEATCSLAHLGDTGCVASVVALLKGPAANLHFTACYTLVEIGGSAGKSTLTNSLRHLNPDTRLAAACALAMLGQTNGLEVSSVFINHTEPWCRIASMISLAQHKSPEAAELLGSKTTDRAPAIARLAGAAMSGQVTARLLEALEDEDVRIRRGAALAFLFLNDPAAIPALQNACHNRDSGTREAARWALGRLQRRARGLGRADEGGRQPATSARIPFPGLCPSLVRRTPVASRVSGSPSLAV